MNDRLAKLTEELSNTKALAEANRKRAADEKERADVAETGQRAMIVRSPLCDDRTPHDCIVADALQEEVEQAREVGKYNAQLHRDLAREQKMRKKLHNDIEDMKGVLHRLLRPLHATERDVVCCRTDSCVRSHSSSI